MIKDFLIISCTGKKDKIGLRINNNFFIHKFQTKIHFRVVESKGDKMWIAWTGYKQEPADDDEDKGLWNIYEDRFNSLTIPTE